MSIECQQVGYLKALPIERAGLPDVPYVSLTEVVCCALYGTPMTPGFDGSLSKLKSACFYLRLMLMGPPVKKSAAEIIFRDEPATINISSRIEELASELTGEIPEWLLPLVYSFNQTGQRFDKIFEWIAINDGQFAVFDEALNEPTRRFYRQLSHAAASGRVVLFGKRQMAGDRAMDRTHEQIDPKNFIGKKVHDLDANELREPKKPNAPAALPPSASNVPNSLNWTDVKVSLAHATMLLLEFSSKLEAVDMQKRGTLQDWNPTWLSLGGAMMWTITRDQQETQLADDLGLGTRGTIKLGIAAQLAYREHETGSRPRFHVEISEAWPVLRHLIADEKILAEGRSIERRGIHGRLETTFPNQQIPSGDVGNLVIFSDVPGIAPKDALGPDEFYQFHGGQGRYWYDVRLRASDVFRELPAPSRSADEVGAKGNGDPPHSDTAPDQPEKVASRPRTGRKPGDGSYSRLDEPLLAEMQAHMDEGRAASPEAAAKLVASKAHGAGIKESKVDRLAKRFRAQSQR